VNAAQGWTLIGAVLGLLAAICTMVVYGVRIEFATLRSEMKTRLDMLDRDVQRLSERFFERS
jgi:hypothetical protein